MHEHDDDEMFDLEESYKPFKLTRNEALYLDDTCTLMVDPHPMDDHDRGRHGGQPMGMRPPVFSATVSCPAGSCRGLAGLPETLWGGWRSRLALGGSLCGAGGGNPAASDVGGFDDCQTGGAACRRAGRWASTYG